MSVKKIVSIFSVFLLSVFILSAASIAYDNQGFRDPDNRKRRDDDYAGVIIKTNVEGAEVYINGDLFGKTPLATVDLLDKNYSVEIRKTGYDTIKCRIHPKRFYTYTYMFVMEKTCGYIKVKGVPSGASVYVDGIGVSSFPKEVDPGSHTVKVRKFGYEDFVQNVYVENHKTQQVDVILTTAPFTISRFKVSKTVINPDYTSSIGKITVSFYVTNDGSAMVIVNDRYGNTVWDRNFSSFSTWEQSCSWDGRGSDGEILPDGQYTIKLLSLDYNFTENVKIDRSLVYPLTAVTPSGSGVGTMPCAFGSSMNYFKLFSTFGAGFNPTGQTDSALENVPMNFGFTVDFARFFELTGSIGVNIIPSHSYTIINNPYDRTEDTVGHTPTQEILTAGGSFKGGTGVNLTSSLSLNLSGFVRYNYSSDNSAYCDYDNGQGFAVGGAIGLDSGKSLINFTGEYVLGVTMRDRDGLRSRDIGKYGAVVSFVPEKNFRTSIWAAMHSTQYLEAGGEIIVMPGTGALSLDAKAWIISDLNSSNNLRVNAQIGLSYLF